MVENFYETNLMDIPSKMFKEAPMMRDVKSYPQFLLIENERKALIGTIDMSSTSWSGSLRYYDDISILSKESAVTTKETYDCCGDAAFLADNKFVVVGDKGAVEIFQVVQTTNEFSTWEFQSLNLACYHDDSVYTVSAFSDSKNVVTGGMDCSIRVWDVDSLITTHSYLFAHMDCVTATEVKPSCDSVFASTSFDGDTLIWDIRQSKPVLRILNRRDKCFSISWNAIEDQFLAVGGDCGMLALMDVRRPNDPLCERTLDNRGIWKILFNPRRKEQLACCFDNTCVKVLNIFNEMDIITEDNRHTDYVRGLAWYNDDLFSCSWDNNVIKRTIPSNDR